MSFAERDPNLWLLTGDLGYSVLEPFAAQFPDRYLNVGIAEQNMTGVAAGLAMAGKTVLTYSIANFPTLRCLEQIRNDVCYHNLNVKVVAIGGGMAYGSLGYTHHAVEDLAIMRSLPNMQVAAPGDPVEAEAVVEAALIHVGPVYIRLGKAGEPIVHTEQITREIGAPLQVRTGADVTLLSTGAILPVVVDAADALEQLGVRAGVMSMPWLSAISNSVAADIARQSGTVICVEEHGPGGLFAAFAEAMSSSGVAGQLRSVCLKAQPSEVCGTQEYLREQSGLTVTAIVNAVLGARRAA